MGESEEDRISFLAELCDLNPSPESITINALVPIPGTPLGSREPASGLDLVRVVASARILLPTSMIRLSAGRKAMSEESQFLCFYAGANSIFLGERLLTSPNPEVPVDMALLVKSGYAPLRME
jgi:biotin synthase